MREVLFACSLHRVNAGFGFFVVVVVVGFFSTKALMNTEPQVKDIVTYTFVEGDFFADVIVDVSKILKLLSVSFLLLRRHLDERVALFFCSRCSMTTS